MSKRTAYKGKRPTSRGKTEPGSPRTTGSGAAKASDSGQGFTVQEVCVAMELMAPTAFAQEWDNVGLIAGDFDAPVRRVLLTIDLTAAVVDEARRGQADLILAYHPPIYKPIHALRSPGAGMEALVFDCIRHGIAIYSPHTALDAADGGTNDVIAGLCGVKQAEPLEYVDTPSPSECKLVVFVPAEHVEKVANAMFGAGAGYIGDYTHCSYRSAGEGTFFGGESTAPTVGKRGRLEHVAEVKLETVAATHDLPGVVDALRSSHPYDEPAFDIYPLKPLPARGIGRCGPLPRPIVLAALARKVKRGTRAECVQIVGAPEATVDRAVIVVGAAGSLPFRIPLTPRHVIITGEIRHHDALTIRRHGCTAIALGHWASERPVLSHVGDRIEELLSGIATAVSRADCDPFQLVSRG